MCKVMQLLPDRNIFLNFCPAMLNAISGNLMKRGYFEKLFQIKGLQRKLGGVGEGRR